MLLIYAALLAFIGWSAWKCRYYVRGVLVGSALLHLMVAVSSMPAGNAGVWMLVVLQSVAIIVAAMLPSTSAALARDRRRRVALDDPEG